jgi:hypothetical protein
MLKKTKKLTEADQVIFSFEMEADLLARYFARRYFGKDTEEWWVADEIGGVYYINDRFFNVQDMVDFIKYKYSADKMFEYYDYALDLAMEGKTPINIKNWKKLK